MKLLKSAKYVAVGLFFCFTAVLSAQKITPDKNNFKNFISEVYINEGASQIAPGTRRYDYMKDLFENRIYFVKFDVSQDASKEIISISQVPLYTTYNTSLTRDEIIDIKNFNPFKYAFQFYTKKALAYRLDGTDYVMVIYPQASGNKTRKL